MRAARHFVAIAIAGGLLVTGRPVGAYCRTGDKPTDACPAVAPGSSGKPIYWASKCAGFVVQSEKVAFASDLPLVVDRAFGLWQERICGEGDGGGTLVAPSMRLLVFGARANLKAGYLPNGGNENVVTVGKLPSSGSEGALALPTVTFSKTTGEILDADLVINESADWSAFDLQTVLNHETGHLLGLAHSDVPDSMMNATADIGTPKQTLEADDRSGLCAVYPPSGTRATADGPIASTACNLAVGTGAASCPTVVSGGCEAGTGADHWNGVSACLATMLCIAAIGRRSRPTRSAS